jgi:hypothetical protein
MALTIYSPSPSISIGSEGGAQQQPGIGSGGCNRQFDNLKHWVEVSELRIEGEAVCSIYNASFNG